jgi:DNA-binding transcriptional LysR family regulator
MDVSLRQLRALVAVAELGGFTQAAKRLHLTQPAVSVLIRGLESTLSISLLHRTTRSTSLTDAGREFYPIAERILADLQNAVANAQKLADRKRGRVTVGATTLISSLLLPGAIAHYRMGYPDIDITLRDGAVASQILQMVESGEVDIGIGPLNQPARSVIAECLLVDTLDLAYRKDHVLASREQVRWRDLAGFPLIALARDNTVRQLIDDNIAKAGIEVRRTHEVSFLSTAIGLVDAGLGIAVLPSHARAIARLYPDIRFVKLSSPEVRRELSLLTRRDRNLSPAAEDFRNYLLSYIKEQGLGTLGQSE